jgi:hypothetical protein
MRQVLESYFAQLMRPADADTSVAMATARNEMAASRRLVAAFQERLSPAERERVVYYLIVGSANQDYRSMFMDGEASMLLSGWSSVVSLVDFSLLVSLSVWVDDLALLDQLVPPPSSAQRKLARMARPAL